jgi:transposase
MPAPYSNDFRQKVIDAHTEQEGGYRTLARRFRVSRDFVRELVQHHTATGNVSPNPRQHGPRPKLDRQHRPALVALLEQHNDATLEQLVELIEGALQVQLGKSSLDRALKRLGITRKKNAARR